ncbi:MAG: ATP-binding protein, partial [Kofleriaceae bacterium]|nr:ATP-binding protein [Kofleriaceae bacterium]
IAPEDLPVHRAARGIEVRDFEEEIRFDDGRSTFLYGSAVPLRDPSGAPRGAIGAFVDVTHLKHAQAVMREADRRKDEFLALLSHELRNPLAPIITAAQLMELRGETVAAQEREVILRQARHLVRLVDDLLDVSRVTRGKVTLAARPIDLTWVIQMAVEATEPLFEQHQHRLTLDVATGGLPVIGDEVRLNQVLSNLLSNAARYTPAGGHIQVVAQREGTEVVVRVRDNGVGIDRVLLPNVFELFVQGERGPDRALGGLGLGLSLVRMFTELHGGSVDVASEGIGKGSEFTLRLPLSASIDTAKTTRAIATTPTPARSRLAPKRILIVDDNQDASLMISRVLESLGHQVRVADDPAEALAVALAFQPEVAILDIGLPVMDGYSLGRELRSRLPTPPSLVALTGYGLAQDRRRSHEAGFVCHLVKPLDVAVLLTALEDLAERQADSAEG